MAYLEVGGQRFTIPQGEVTIGSDPAAGIVLGGAGIAPRHAVAQGMADGGVAIRRAGPDVVVQVNGVALGPQPNPLLHGDKVEIGNHELRFVDERKSGSTQYVQAIDPSAMSAAAKPAAKRGPTGSTGGRLVSLTDGREYVVTGASLLIGRDAGCDVVITGKAVSRRHAEIMVTPKGYLLVDSSTNGSFVNGQRIQGQQLLARGDVIQCGDNEFRFYADAAAAPAAPAPAATPAAAPPPATKPARPAAAPVKPATPPAQRPAAAGAEYRLSNTLHGVPGARPGAAPVSAAGALAHIVVRNGPLKGRRFAIRVPVVNVGRAEYNDIVLPDDSVSTQHAKIQRREGIWVVVDLGSTNGTLVDGARVTADEVPLAPGALLRFGDVQAIFEPTDDAHGIQKGGSTRVLSAIKLPDPKPPNG